MSEAEEAAKGLTAAQKAAMVSQWKHKPGGSIVPCPEPVRKALARRGLVETAYGFATKHGFAVRRILRGDWA